MEQDWEIETDPIAAFADVLKGNEEIIPVGRLRGCAKKKRIVNF